MTNFLQLTIIGLGMGSIYALLAVGFVLIYKSSKVLNFAHGQLVMMTAYFGILVLVQMGVPIWVGLLLTIALAGLLGAGVNRFLMRPMIGQPLIATIMITIALASVLSALCTMFWGGSTWRYPRFIPSAPANIAGAAISQEVLYSSLVIMILVILLSYFFYRTPWGLAMRSVAEDHQVAKSMGVNVNRVFMGAWILSGVIISIAGIILGHFLGVGPVLSEIGLKSLPAALIGGLESLPGAVIAGFLIGLAETFAAGYIDPHVGGGTSSVFPYVLMIIVILLRPYGLLGTRKVERI